MVQALIHAGVTHLFGYPGAAICPFYDALADAPIRHILTRNEQGAAHAASGYARTSGRTGVCVATSGPGATNLITGIATAYMDSIPLLAITGQVETGLIGSDSFQEADITGAVSPFTKHTYLVQDAAALPRIFAEAFYIAATGRPGPVLIDIPVDLQTALLPDDLTVTGPVQLPGYRPERAVRQDQLTELEALLDQSAAPIICAGGGVISSNGTAALRQVCERLQIPVVTTLMGIGCLPCDHPLYLGTLGSHGVFAANYALHKADLVILIGARVGNRAMGSAAEIARRARIVHIDIDPAEIGKNIRPHLAIIADARTTLTALMSCPTRPHHLAWTTQAQAIRDQNRQIADLDAPSDSIHPPSLMRRLGELAGDQAILTTEVGQNQIWAANHYPVRTPRTFISSGGMGTMGYGLPAALGAWIARPERTVIAVSGDGSLQMSIQELGTIRQERAAVKIVLLNNNRLGMVHEIQSLKYNRRYSQVFLEENPDFQLLAAAYGFGHDQISSNDQIDGAIRRMLETPGAYLLECRIDPHEPTLYARKRSS
jgi:acetolactate synthase-1/2/3 large subunit